MRVNNEAVNRGTTDTQGLIQLQNTANETKIYAEKAFYSFTNPKAVDANFSNNRSLNPYYTSNSAGAVNGKGYTFVISSDIRVADGNYYDFPGQGKTLANAPRDTQGNVLIQLVHPKIEWNLVVAFEQAQSDAYYAKLKTGFQNYANFMYNYTDGYSLIKNIVIVKGTYSGKPQWDYSDVQIKNNEWPNAHAFGNRWGNYKLHIHMTKVFNGIEPDREQWSVVIGHESGHYLLGFFDEYINGNNTKGSNENPLWPYRTSHDGDSGEPNEFPKDYGLMDKTQLSREMSDPTDYFQRTYSTTMNPDLVTRQFTRNFGYYDPPEYNLPEYKGKSCWSFFKLVYEKDIKQQMAGQGFSDAFFNNLIIPPHTTGSYPNSDRTKRNGPAVMNRDSVNFIDWTVPGTRRSNEPLLFDASIYVTDEKGIPIPAADVWLVSDGNRNIQGRSDKNGLVILSKVINCDFQILKNCFLFNRIILYSYQSFQNQIRRHSYD